jgi:hypothetical protein
MGAQCLSMGLLGMVGQGNELHIRHLLHLAVMLNPSCSQASLPALPQICTDAIGLTVSC